MSSVNFKLGLKRIGIVLSFLYLIFVTVVLIKSDCIGFLERGEHSRIIRETNIKKINKLEQKLPVELRKATHYYYSANGGFHSSDFLFLDLDKAVSDAQKVMDKMRKKYEDVTHEIHKLWVEIKFTKQEIGNCESIFIWRIGSKRYSNIGTMLGTTLGGLILLWLVPYILIFWVGSGLYWVLCWIKAGFITEPSKSNESEARVKGEEEKDLYFAKKRLFFEQPDTDETIDKTTNLTEDANEEGDWGTFPWAAKAILLQLFAFLGSVLIVAAITTYITPLKPSYRSSLNVIIAVASFFPIWQPGKRNFKRKFISWLLSALAGCIIYLSSKTVLLSLYKAGVLSIHQTGEIAGYTVGLGMFISIFLSYFINKRGQK